MARARGNPFFIEELTRSLRENGYIHEHQGEYVLSKRLLEIASPGHYPGHSDGPHGQAARDPEAPPSDGCRHREDLRLTHSAKDSGG